MASLFTNIKTLINVRNKNVLLRGKELADLPVIDNAYLIVEGNLIASYGSMNELNYKPSDFAFCFDCSDCLVLPAWCDSHTHAVFARYREDEFVQKINGATYAEIAAKGGGILASAKVLNQTSEEELFTQANARLQDLARLGTGAIEIKSGYGLTVEGELKMLRVIKRLKQSSKQITKATFLGAHAIPDDYKNNREGYIDLIRQQMLPQIAAEKLADFIDVFCEENFFSPEETVKICEAGKDYGLQPKIHANQLNVSGGVQAAVKAGALSADHLESMDEAAIKSLAGSTTIGTLLPSAAFFLGMPYQPARALVNANAAIGIASDFNPGSSPSGNMNFVVSLACIGLRLTPEEAINAATTNGAFAMNAQEECGSISVGKLANLIVTKPVPSLYYLPYAFGENHIQKVMLAGEWIQ